MTTNPYLRAVEVPTRASPPSDLASEESLTPETARAYRRLAVVMLRLDVATVAAELRAKRFTRDLVPIAA